MGRSWQRLALIASLAVLVLSACDRKTRLPEYELAGMTMGTTYSVKLVAPPESVSRQALGEEIAGVLAAVNQVASTYIEDSDLSMFNASPSTDWIEVSSELCALIEDALEISRQTDGAFDITVGPLVNLWGFGPQDRRQKPPGNEEIEDALRRTGYHRLETRCASPALRKDPASVFVDLSGWAKGYAVDRLAEVLDRYAIDNYLVEIGGELRVRGHNADGLLWAIAIEEPNVLARAPKDVFRLTDTSVATSGDYRNFFEHEGTRYSHTIDTTSGYPVVHDLAAVTVLSPSAATADAMATALLVLGPVAGFEMAETSGVAGYFVVRGEAGFKTLTTTAFDRMVTR